MNEERKSREGRTVHWREGFALGLAVILAILLVGAVVWAWLQTFAVEQSTNALERIQTLQPFGVIAVAAVTFATVLWRGLISARQANTGLEQLKETRRQIALTESNNMAVQLQKGAELIAEASEPKVRVGILSLQTLAEAGTKAFRHQARSILLSFIEDKVASKEYKMLGEAIRAQNAAFDLTKEAAERAVDLNYNGVNESYPIPHGARFITIKDARIKNEQIRSYAEERHVFQYVHFEQCFIHSETAVFTDCTFHRCGIGAILEYTMRVNDFSDCNFSDANIVMRGNALPADLRQGGNYYFPHKPPKSTLVGVDWSQFLNPWLPAEVDS